MFFWLDNVDVLSGVVCTRRVLVGVIVGRSTTEFIVGLCEKGEDESSELLTLSGACSEDGKFYLF